MRGTPRIILAHRRARVVRWPPGGGPAHIRVAVFGALLARPKLRHDGVVDANHAAVLDTGNTGAFSASPGHGSAMPLRPAGGRGRRRTRMDNVLKRKAPLTHSRLADQIWTTLGEQTVVVAGTTQLARLLEQRTQICRRSGAGPGSPCPPQLMSRPEATKRQTPRACPARVLTLHAAMSGRCAYRHDPRHERAHSSTPATPTCPASASHSPAGAWMSTSCGLGDGGSGATVCPRQRRREGAAITRSSRRPAATRSG